MYHTSNRRLIAQGMLGLLILLLAACGSGGTVTSSPTTGTSGTIHSTPSSSTNAPPLTSTVTFTASGGLNGLQTIPDTQIESVYIQASKIVQISLEDSAWKVLTGITTYAGPGSYTISQFVLGPQGTTNLADEWTIPPGSSASCSLTVTSDTPVNAPLGSKVNEIKGTFSCPTLPSGTKPSVTLSNGRFDVFVNQQ